MEVTFRSAALLDCYRRQKARTKAWGAKVAALYVQRVDTLYAAQSAQDLRALRSLDFHALKGQRAGEYAIRLDGFYRLIVTFQDRNMTVVNVEEVSKHYGD